jgi:hypothetical protein
MLLGLWCLWFEARPMHERVFGSMALRRGSTWNKSPVLVLELDNANGELAVLIDFQLNSSLHGDMKPAKVVSLELHTQA